MQSLRSKVWVRGIEEHLPVTHLFAYDTCEVEGLKWRTFRESKRDAGADFRAFYLRQAAIVGAPQKMMKVYMNTVRVVVNIIVENHSLGILTRYLIRHFEMEVLQEAPKSDTFIPLSEHQSATPASFYSGPPVLHYHSGRCKVVILERELNQSLALTVLARHAQDTSTTAETVTNGNGDYSQEEAESETQKILDNVDIWVTSEYATSLLNSVGPRC